MNTFFKAILASLALVFATVTAPAYAQTISPPVGCIAGIDCAAKSITLSGNAVLPSGGVLNWTNRGSIGQSSDGVYQFTNNTGTNTVSITAGTSGSIAFGGAIFPNGNLIMPQANSIQFNGITVITAANDGVLRWAKNNGSQNTVSTLVACSSILDGMRGFVTDATVTTFASAVAGSGTNHVPVYCDGSGTPTWKIG